MRIACPKCKAVHEADNKMAVCPSCRTVLRRCSDCAQYDIRITFCKAVNRAIPTGESDYPTFGSASTYCRAFAPKVQPPAA